MKRFIYVLIAILFLTAIPQIASAQDAPLRARNASSSKKEKKIDRKKNAAAAENKKAQQEEEDDAEDGMYISNPCDDWLDIELVSLIGAKGAQTMKMTLKITNHEVNREMNVGTKFVSYDEEGNAHNDESWNSSMSCKKMFVTDVPIKVVLNIPGKFNPSKIKKMLMMSFNVADCRIEFRNVPITWK